MKSNSSLLTRCTKLGSLNFHEEDEGGRLVTIFTKQGGRIYQIQMDLESQSISNTILKSIQRFNNNYEINLSTDISSYSLYAARKNGRPCSDYPPFQNGQDLALTKIFAFFLKHKKATQIQLTRIKTNFNRQQKKQVSIANKMFCSCLFSS